MRARSGWLRHLRRLRARQRRSGGGVHRRRAGGANLMGGIVDSWGDSVPVLFLAGHNERTKIAASSPRSSRSSTSSGRSASGPRDQRSVQGGGDAAARLHAYARRRPGPVALGVPRRPRADGGQHFEYLPVSPRPRCAAAPIRTRSTRRSISSAMRSGRTSMSAPACCSRKRPTSWCASPSCDAAGRDHAERQERVPGKPSRSRSASAASAAPPIARCRPRCLARTRRHPHRRLRLQAHATSGAPEPARQTVQVDVDPTEVNRDHVADVAILGDAKVVLRQLTEAARRALPGRGLRRSSGGSRSSRELKHRWAAICAPLLGSDEKPINPFRVAPQRAAAARSEAL